jgi:hypothetical protein
MVKLVEEPGTCQALALYAAELPPSPAEVRRRLGSGAYRWQALPPGPRGSWGFRVEHPEWGPACIAGMPEVPALPSSSVEFCSRLLPEEKAHARAARSVLAVIASERAGHAAQDRKFLLRFLELLLDPSSPHATGYDCRANKLWSADALREELEHDADLDIDALLELHGTSDVLPATRPRTDGRGLGLEGPRVDWLHSHGLAELGAYDFEILRPSPQLLGASFELVRGIAHRLLHGTLDPHAPRQTLFVPDGAIALVEAARFDAEGPLEERALRVRLPHGDPHDGPRRLVVCDPLVAADPQAQRTSSWPIRASRALRRIPREGAVIDFPPQVTALLAERAQKTVPALRAIAEELAEVTMPPLLQVFCPIDPSVPDTAHEILHFELIDFTSDETFEAELLQNPARTSALARGRRISIGIEDLANWSIATPIGPITPYDRTAARMLRRHLPSMREELAAAERTRRR